MSLLLHVTCNEYEKVFVTFHWAAC